MPFRPLQRFRGVLDGMVPTANYGGLLTPADERAAGRDARMMLAAGMLSAGGPQRMPVSLGQAIGASLPAAMETRDRRAEVGVRNEQLRRQIERENKESANVAKLGNILRASGPDGELLGVLSDINPQAASQLVLQGVLGGGDSREPTDIATMRAIGLPLNAEGFAQFQEMKGDSGTNAAIEALNLQIQGLNLANMKREQEKEDQEIRETRLTRENAIERGIEQTQKIAALNRKLEGTALAAGLPASTWRRQGMGVLAGVGGALGLNVEELTADLDNFDTFKKNLNDQLITLMSAGSLGQGTDSKLQQYRDSLASPDTSPGAIMEIQANIAQLLLDQADVLQFDIGDRDAIEASIKEMRDYVPPGTETVLDVPAAAAATGRAVVRAADIGRMGFEQLQQLDPASMTQELRDAAERRWDELNAR